MTKDASSILSMIDSIEEALSVADGWVDEDFVELTNPKPNPARRPTACSFSIALRDFSDPRPPYSRPNRVAGSLVSVMAEFPWMAGENG